MNEKFRIKKVVNAFRCLRCNHEWIPRVSLDQLEGVLKEMPKICPKCKSVRWNVERKKK